MPYDPRGTGLFPEPTPWNGDPEPEYEEWPADDDEVCPGCGNHPVEPMNDGGLCNVCIEERCPADVHRHPVGCPDADWCRGNRCCYWGCNEPDLEC